MTTLIVKSLDHPHDVRPTADKGRIELVKMGDVTVGRATRKPGRRWSEHVKPLTGTELCEATHTGYVVSSRQFIRMADGGAVEMGRETRS